MMCHLTAETNYGVTNKERVEKEPNSESKSERGQMRKHRRRKKELRKKETISSQRKRRQRREQIKVI